MNNHKTIVIDLEENEKCRTGQFNELEKSEVSSVLSVKNVSETNRIWNVRVLLADSTGGTDIEEEELIAGEIDAGSQWEHNYAVDIEAPLLVVREVFDTCSEVDTEDPHWAYAFGRANPVEIVLIVKNNSNGVIDNIIVNKTMPEELSQVMVQVSEKGSAEYDEGTKQVFWKDVQVNPGEEARLSITAVGEVEDSEMKSAGELVVSYRAEGQQRSSLDPDMTGLTEFLTGIETAETEPNCWEVTLECSNESDLMVRLDKAQIFLHPEEGGEKQLKVDEKPGFEMEPGQEWTTSFEVKSKSPPKCTQEVVYTPMRVIKKRVLGKIVKEPQPIPVYEIKYTKTFDPPEVSSFDKTPIEVNIDIENVGSASINEIVVEDHLPEDVMPPKKEHVTIWIAGEEYNGPFDLQMEPDNQDPETPHKLTFTIGGLKEIVGELEPGKSVRINYAVMAWKSRPEKEYPSPIHITANIVPPGHATEISSEEGKHEIGVVYKKRRISAKKAINKGAGAGEYSVLLVVENRGEVTVENVKVTDWIPSGFEFVSVEPPEEEPTLSQVEDGTNISWLWTRMNPGDKKKLRVNVRGEGEYERREPKVVSD